MPIKNPHPLYTTWAHIKNRAKTGGIPIDPRWNSFQEFLKDMGERPAPSMKIYRKSVDKGYDKSNCAWYEKYADQTKIQRGPRPNSAIRHPLYFIWRSMIGRCDVKSSKQFKDYGGRGITICERWRNSFWDFVADMGPKPSPKYSIDRINNDGNYEPGNCRWATRTQQQRNQHHTRKVMVEGKEYVAADLADIAGLKTDTIIERAKQNLTMQELLSKERRVYYPGLAVRWKHAKPPN